MTRAYPELADLGRQAGLGDMVLDGEIAAFTGGRPSFAALQRRMHAGAPAPHLVAAVPVTYLVFDIMYAGGQPLISEPYARRRAILEAQPLAGPHVHVPPSFPGGGHAVLAVSVRDGLEGVVVKRLDSPYQPGRRSPAWLKIKNRRLLDVVVGGISPGRGQRAGRIGSLLVGIPSGAGLAYAGRVGTGFTQPVLRALEEVLAPLRRDSPPFSGPIPPVQARNVTWVEPRLVIQVSYAEQTPDGILRAAAFQGLTATRNGSAAGPLALSGPAGAARLCRLPPGRARRYHPLPGRARRCRPLLGRARRCRLPRAELVGATWFGAQQAFPGVGYVRRIACHVSLLLGSLLPVLPGRGHRDTKRDVNTSGVAFSAGAAGGHRGPITSRAIDGNPQPPAPPAFSAPRDSLAMTADARRGPGGYDQSWPPLFPAEG